MTKEELLELLDCDYIYVALHSVEYGDISDYFIVKLDIDKLTSRGIIVKQNEYGVVIVPYEGYKEYWAMHEGDLK